MNNYSCMKVPLMRLPPTTALRALDAAARHLSFTKAAEELHVSQSAVSHQIRHLEELWQVKLFTRLTRRLELTEAGKALSQLARGFFHDLDTTLTAVRDNSTVAQVRVLVPPSIALKWLVPRLPDFRRAHPDVDVWIKTQADARLRPADDFDAALQFGPDNRSSQRSWRLMQEFVFPVASPQFLKNCGDAATMPHDLCRHPLLLRTENNKGAPDWQLWFESAAVPENIFAPALQRGVRFPNTNMALQAAIDGQGIALARSAPAWDDLKAGRLVRLLSLRCPFAHQIHLVSPKSREQNPAVSAFRSWLQTVSAESQAAFDAAEPGSEPPPDL